MVAPEGFEPPPHMGLVPKTSAAANFATGPFGDTGWTLTNII